MRIVFHLRPRPEGGFECQFQRVVRLRAAYLGAPLREVEQALPELTRDLGHTLACAAMQAGGLPALDLACQLLAAESDWHQHQLDELDLPLAALTPAFAS